MKLVHPSSLVHATAIIGKDTTVGLFCNILAGCSIGDNTIIGQNVFIDTEVIVGRNVVLGNNVSLCRGTFIEDDVFIGSSVVFTQALNPRTQPPKIKQARSIVKYSARISPNATIFQGNTIGRFAFIGAGAVITKAVLDYALIVGNPASQVGWVSEQGSRLSFVNNKATCHLTGEEYVLEGRKVRKV